LNALARIIAAVRGGDRRALEALPPLERRVAVAANVVVFTIQKLIADRAPLLAAALAYRTLFSLIPVLVLGLMFLRVFYQGDEIRPAVNSLLEYLAIDEIAIGGDAEGEAGGGDGAAQPTEVAAFINEFIENAQQRLAAINYGAITAVGIAIFIYAAISLLIQIEHAFNAVCRAPVGRSFVVRLTNYWTLLTLGTLGLFASFTIGAGYTQRLDDLPGYLAWLRPVLRVASTVGVAWLVLIFAYARMPNARVRLRPAAIGAALAAVLWELSKTGLTWFMANAVSGQVSVYGSLALVPLLMFWIYVTWLIVLAGLEIATSLQSFRAGAGSPHADTGRSGPPLIDPAMAAPIMVEIARRFARGRPTEPETLARATRLSERQLEPILRRLIGDGLLHRVDHDDDNEITLALARPADTITVAEIIDAAASLAPEPADPGLAGVMARLHRVRDQALDGHTLADLLPDPGDDRPEEDPA
jgi:membrane protein